jgi:hypothetical protein
MAQELDIRDPRTWKILEKKATGYERASKSQLMSTRTYRNQWLIPLIGIVALILFVVGPSLTVILQIISTVHPLIWVGGLFVALFFWRRYV